MVDTQSPYQSYFEFESSDADESAASPETRVRVAIESCYRHAEIYFQCDFDRPRLAFNLQGMAAAAAYPAQNTIRLNNSLLSHNFDDFLSETVPHEVSHLIAYRLHGRGIAPHGSEWTAIMSEVFRRTPRRCHDYDVSFAMRESYSYRCGCATQHRLSLLRHRRAMCGRRYYCRRCRQILTFLHSIR